MGFARLVLSGDRELNSPPQKVPGDFNVIVVGFLKYIITITSD